MTQQFSPYIAFPGNAAEAFPYYQQLFGGELELTTYGSMDLQGMPFEPPADAVAHATMTAPTFSLAGGDAMGEAPALQSDVYSFLLTMDTEDEGRRFIDTVLADGGEPLMPFERAPWGDHYGQVRDRFGIRWDVTVPAAEN